MKAVAIMNAERAYIRNVFKNRHSYRSQGIEEAIEKVAAAKRVIRYQEQKMKMYQS